MGEGRREKGECVVIYGEEEHGETEHADKEAAPLNAGNISAPKSNADTQELGARNVLKKIN